MAERKLYSALSKKEIVVPAYSVYTVDYLDSKPNYFRVQNLGAVNIYCSTSHMPTQERYDFLTPAQGIKMFAEPYQRTRLYIYNPSGSDIHAVVLSFYAEFDPLTLALSEIDLDLSNVVLETNSVINGFKTPLPEGGNMIGKVELGGSIPAGNNQIGSVIATPDLSALGKVRAGNLSLGTGFTHVIHINYITNDSETEDYTFTIDGNSILLKPGETLANFDMSPVKMDLPAGEGRYLVRTKEA